MNSTTYTPILKTKQGELQALKQAAPEVGTAFTPILEIHPIPLKWDAGEDEPYPSKTIRAHLTAVAKSTVNSCSGLEKVYVDGFYVEEEDQLPDGSEPIAYFLTRLREANIQHIPVTGLDRVGEYNAAIRATISRDQQGCCLRLLETDLEGLADLGAQVQTLLGFLRVDPEHVDLLLDFGPRVPSKAAIPYQIAALPYLDRWRSFTVSACSFPRDLSQVKQNSIVEIDREEWGVWTFLRSRRHSVKRMPRFADYGINHPEPFEMNPRMMRPSPNIRYTHELHYVVAKGEAMPRKKDKKQRPPPAVQYPELAKKIMGHEAWQGKGFSWGDGRIHACSRTDFVGNSSSWRAVGTSHHIAYVVNQLASLL